MLLEKLHELGRRHTEHVSHPGHVSAGRIEVVERFGEEWWIVVMLEAHREPPAPTPGLPPRGRAGRDGWNAVFDGQTESHSPEGHAAVFRLGASLGGLGGQPRGQMGEHDGRFGLVAVLPSRAGPLRADLTAFGEEGSRVEGGGVRHATERD